MAKLHHYFTLHSSPHMKWTKVAQGANSLLESQYLLCYLGTKLCAALMKMLLMKLRVVEIF